MLYNKMNHSLSVIGLLLLAAFSSCNPDERPDGENTLEYFLRQQQMSVHVGGTAIFRYNEYETQIACNPARKMLRFQANNQEVYVQMIFSEIPDVPENKSLGVALNYIEVAGETKSLRTVLKMVKQEGGFCWYWDEEKKVGMVVSEDWVDLFK